MPGTKIRCAAVTPSEMEGRSEAESKYIPIMTHFNLKQSKVGYMLMGVNYCRSLAEYEREGGSRGV